VKNPKPQTIPHMLSNLLGDAQKQQEEMKRQLATITVEASAGDGAVKVTANGNRQILDISIDKEKMDWEDVEQVQDIILAAVNRALELAAGKEQAESQKLIQQMLPPGLGGLFG
jgi:nucleoid-associated protein EbfC